MKDREKKISAVDYDAYMCLALSPSIVTEEPTEELYNAKAEDYESLSSRS